MPPLIRFLLKWIAVGTGAGWLFLAALLVFDVGDLGSMLMRSREPLVVLYILGLSFAVTFSQASLLIAALLGNDFSGRPSGTSRLERWKAGQSAELKDDDRPLPRIAGAGGAHAPGRNP